jgi:hypothetical protein
MHEGIKTILKFCSIGAISYLALKTFLQADNKNFSVFIKNSLKLWYYIPAIIYLLNL